MKKSTAVLIIITLLLLAVSGFAAYMTYHAKNENRTAYIYRGDELLYTIDLDSVSQSYTIELVSDAGHVNTVEVRKSYGSTQGEIGIISADCPDKICVKTGFIGDGVMPIVCVPNGIMIVIKDSGGQIDAQA